MTPDFIEAIASIEALWPNKLRAEVGAARLKYEEAWNACLPIPDDHSYLKANGIQSYGVRLHYDKPVIRVNDEAGRIIGLRYLGTNNGLDEASVIKGLACPHSIIGDMDEAEEPHVYLIHSHISGSNIHEATGAPVMVAELPDRIPEYLQYIDEAYPWAEPIICLEQPLIIGDEHGEEYPHESLAAADEFSASFAILPKGVTTWKELRQRHGLDAVRKCAKHQFSLPDVWLPNFRGLVSSWSALSSDLCEAKPRLLPVLSTDDLLNVPEQEYLIKDVLPRYGIGCIYGPSASGKTFVVLDMVNAIARGKGWFGHKVTQCKVLYICLEGKGGFPARIKAYIKHHNIEGNHLVEYVMAQLSLLSDRDTDALIATAMRAGIKHGLIVIDTLSAATPGMDENQSAEMGIAIKTLKRIQAATKSFVLTVHHSGKDATRGLRGHSSYFAAQDAVIEIKREDERRSLKLAKSKDGSDDIEHHFRLSKVEIGKDRDGNSKASCVVVAEENATNTVKRVKPASGNQTIVYEVIGELLRASKDSGKGGAPAYKPCICFEAAIDGCVGRLTVSEERRAKERARDAIKAMVSKGILMLRDGWVWVP
jgi:AAA domain